MTLFRQYLAKRFAVVHKSPLHGTALLARILNHQGVASGLCTEPPVHRKPSGTVINSTLSLLLPNNQGKHLPDPNYRIPISACLASIPAGVSGQLNYLLPRGFPNCLGLLPILPKLP